MRIRQLSSNVVTKIAAGEVIERPASVVKELVENSVDADSTRIEIDLEQGGADLIRVVDNGGGIHPDDFSLAFSSHATSKLADAEDLFQIGTLGFRGEALASIGGVARVNLQSRQSEQSVGAEMSCHGGDVSSARPWNGAAGTRIDVAHLFYNTPVRRKFLRTTATELGHVCEVFTRLALARPTLHLLLRHNEKQVYEVPAHAGLLERLGLFFGMDVQDQLYAVEGAEGVARLHGFMADPACDRGNAKQQYLFVNGRWIRDRSLSHAVQEAYRGLLMTGRYAVAVLFLELPPDQVDVNVHPTKAEVRFREGSVLYHLVLRTLRDRLRAADLTGKLRVNTFTGQTEHQGPRLAAWFSPAPALPSGFSSFPATTLPLPPDNPVHQNQAPTHASNGVELSSRSASKAIQLYNAYLVLETPEGMLVIDQHALHERILFEQLKAKIRSGPLESQKLLIPEPVDLPAEQAAKALEHREALSELGLSVEDFGGGTLLLVSYPAIMANRPAQTILRTVIDHLLAKDRVPDREHLLNDLLSLMACHAAVRAGDPLTAEAIEALIAQRELAMDTHHCPHGRPTSLLLSRQDLDRQFRRV